MSQELLFRGWGVVRRDFLGREGLSFGDEGTGPLNCVDSLESSWGWCLEKRWEGLGKSG